VRGSVNGNNLCRVCVWRGPGISVHGIASTLVPHLSPLGSDEPVYRYVSDREFIETHFNQVLLVDGVNAVSASTHAMLKTESSSNSFRIVGGSPRQRNVIQTRGACKSFKADTAPPPVLPDNCSAFSRECIFARYCHQRYPARLRESIVCATMPLVPSCSVVLTQHACRMLLYDGGECQTTVMPYSVLCLHAQKSRS